MSSLTVGMVTRTEDREAKGRWFEPEEFGFCRQRWRRLFAEICGARCRGLSQLKMRYANHGSHDERERDVGGGLGTKRIRGRPST